MNQCISPNQCSEAVQQNHETELHQSPYGLKHEVIIDIKILVRSAGTMLYKIPIDAGGSLMRTAFVGCIVGNPTTSMEIGSKMLHRPSRQRED